MSKNNLSKVTKRGYPLPLGVTVLNEGINFSLFSRHASQVTLVIDRIERSDDKPVRYEIPLKQTENKTGDIWHILLETTQTGFCYGYRVYGTGDKAGCVFNSENILIDPYCQSLSPRKWGEISKFGKAPCCRILNHDFDWANDRPLKTPLSQTVIYELHVRGFSNEDTSSPATSGTYLGIIDKIPYLRQLGITAVELMPITEFDENDSAFYDPETGQPLKNFWGYNPVSFFALKSGYAQQPDKHVNEFKSMVKALHEAGIEVILDIVYNHTGESGYDGITSSFRGLDNPVYYLLDSEDQAYLNYSGCGNTLNCNHPIVRSLIRHSLRYWVMEMHIDGFRFDLASILGRDQEGNVLPNPPMIEIIAEDPILRDTKIIAEAWDAAGLYQVGSFSTDSRWGEWNGRFRDDIRSFMAGHSGMVTRLATRIAGSSDLYQSSHRSPLNSINFITSHDGFTLHDLVSYDQKNNLSNGENNRDGDSHNISWNSGHEGPYPPADVQQLRNRRIRSMFIILMISQGVPMITAGDEFGRSQQGNNNAWCQDNPISWLNWQFSGTNHELLRFCRQSIELRRRHPVFRREEFFPTTTSGSNVENEVSWQYLSPDQHNWSEDCHGLGVLLHGSRKGQPRDDDFFIMLNGNQMQDLTFTPPPVPQNSKNRQWHLIVDTSAKPPKDIMLKGNILDMKDFATILVPPFTVKILQSLPNVS